MTSESSVSVIRDPFQLAEVLESELGFYRSLYVLFDRQRDRLVNGDGHDIAADFAEVEDLKREIEAREHRIAELRSVVPGQLEEWTRTPEVTSVAGKIMDIIGRCRALVADCERLAQERLTSYRRELDAMGQGRRLFSGMAHGDSSPRFLDARP
ncbi:MAG: hypothetical protein AB1792_03275 [Candidatus Zixiibacteriota bacterium]